MKNNFYKKNAKSGPKYTKTALYNSYKGGKK